MNSATRSLFSQLLSVIDRHHFATAVRETRSEYGAKGFSSWDHFTSMLFCQLAQAKSLREIHAGLRSCEGKLQHLGMKQAPRRSTLSYANAHRPAALFEQVFYQVLSRVRTAAPRKNFSFEGKLYSLDSSLIQLCSSMFDWAKYTSAKGAAKLHLVLDHDGHLPVYALLTEGRCNDLRVAKQLSFPTGAIVVMDRGYMDYGMFAKWTKQGVGLVTRIKENSRWHPHTRYATDRDSHILRNEIGKLGPDEHGPDYRCIEVWDERNKYVMYILTNRLDLDAETVAEIYRQRWQIELFFKAIKQNFRIKTFVGTSANAVEIQIWTALTAMLLFKLLQFQSKRKWALSNLIALMRWNLFTHKALWSWIDNPYGPTNSSPPGELKQAFLDGIPG